MQERDPLGLLQDSKKASMPDPEPANKTAENLGLTEKVQGTQKGTPQQLDIKVGHINGRVILEFVRPVRQIVFTVPLARGLAQALLKACKQVVRSRPDNKRKKKRRYGA